MRLGYVTSLLSVSSRIIQFKVMLRRRNYIFTYLHICIYLVKNGACVVKYDVDVQCIRAQTHSLSDSLSTRYRHVTIRPQIKVGHRAWPRDTVQCGSTLQWSGLRFALHCDVCLRQNPPEVTYYHGRFRPADIMFGGHCARPRPKNIVQFSSLIDQPSRAGPNIGPRSNVHLNACFTDDANRLKVGPRSKSCLVSMQSPWLTELIGVLTCRPACPADVHRQRKRASSSAVDGSCRQPRVQYSETQGLIITAYSAGFSETRNIIKLYGRTDTD